MTSDKAQRQVVILLVEDNRGDARLIAEALKESDVNHEIRTAEDGIEAMAFLRGEGEHRGAPVPDLVLLDLNMPRMNGREVLAEIKQDPGLRATPVVVLTTSDADRDVLSSYRARANCFISKPVDFEGFTRVMQGIENMWLKPLASSP